MDLLRLTDSLPLPQSLRLLLLNLVLVLAYLALAKFGLGWSSLTTDVTLIWPAAGLALFSIMTFGLRAAPGVLIGSASATLLLHFNQQDVPLGPESLLATLAMSSADLLQVVLIAKLNSQLLLRNSPIRSRRVLFFIGCVLLCCVFSASVGVVSLYQLGLLNLGTLPENWLTWWMGDCIGMLVFTPLLAWALLPGLRHQDARAQAFLLLSSGLGVLLLLVATLGYLERSAARDRFEGESNLLWLALSTRLSGSLHDLDLAQHNITLGGASDREFLRLARSLLEHNPWLNHIAWVPTQAGEQLEPSLAALNLGDSQMVTRHSTRITRAKLALGHPGNRTVILNAWQQRELRVGPVYYGERGRPALEIYSPVMTCPSEQPCSLRGLLSAQLNLTEWASQAFSPELPDQLQLLLVTGGPDPLRLQWQPGGWVDASPDSNQPVAHLRYQRSLPLADQTMEMITYHQNPLWFVPSWLQVSTLGIGLALISLLSAYLITRQKHQDLLMRNQSRLQEEIHISTQALRKANDWLLKEVEQRQQTQEQLESSQEVLRRREQELRSLLDNIPDPIWLKDIEGHYLNCNRAFAQLLGKTEQEIVGKREHELVSADIAQVFRRNDRVALGSAGPHRHEQWLVAADGRLHMLDTLKVAVRDADNQTYGILGIGRDITDKHELISELEKFKRFAEFSAQGFGIASLKGETLYMNPSMRRMLSDRSTHEGDFKQQFWLYYPPELQVRVRDDIFPKVVEQGHWQGELAALHADGSDFPTQETFFVIRDDQGKPQYIGNVMTDISAQKETEAELSQAKEAAEEAARAKSRFLANMSHEIRTPLNAVLGYTQLLMRDPQLAGNQRERLQLILNASQRLLGLINDVLDLSKIESGALNLRQDYFDLHQEMQEIHAIIAERANAKGLSLGLEIDFPAPNIVRGDRQKLGQILLNLLGNAVKFTHQGSVNLMLTRHGDWVDFVISDTGPGIAPQELEQLFSAFRQGQAGQDSGGTGLGLTLSRHLAQGMGGSLELTSQLGEGTRAHLRLPLPSEALTRHNSDKPNTIVRLAPGSHCHVLVVEDDQASADVLVSLLEQLGCTTRCAYNGREGIDWCAQERFDIIFTDIRMPDVNGLEMLRQLRRQADFVTPLVAVSASSLEHERTYYLAQGFHDFIGKPYGFEEIFSALQQHSGARFEAPEPAPSQPLVYQDDPINFNLAGQSLQQIRQAAASGDMSLSKKLASQLSADLIGQQRHQLLLAAIRQYDLERVESLVNGWLDSKR